jgi:hypothetical protein
VVFKTPTVPELKTPIHDILDITLLPAGNPPTGKYTDVELTDGTLMHCRTLTVKGNEFQATLASSGPTGPTVKFPLASVYYLLNDAQDEALRKQWAEKYLDKYTKKQATQDTLVIRNPETKVVNAVEGTLGEGNDKGEIFFEIGIGNIKQKRTFPPTKTNVVGMIFLRNPGSEGPARLCNVFDVSHNTFAAAKLALDAKSFKITTVAGAVLECPRPTISRLEYDKIIFLSDLKPIDTVQKSKQGRQENVKIDKNLENTPLKLDDQPPYSKGMAIHAHTELTYALDGKFSKLDAVVGMDASVTGDGKPVVRIEADGRELFNATITRKEKRRELSLDVKGVKQLRVVVTSTGLFDFGDHVDIAYPKLSK